MITDDNALGDILGAIGLTQGQLAEDDPKFAPAALLGEVVERIELKLERCRNQVRRSWFTRALGYVTEVRRCHSGDADRAIDLLWKADEFLKQGSKAHRRKATFVVRPEGTAERI